MMKVYDRAYFDHWYRHPSRAAELRRALRNKVQLAIAVAEYHLGRRVRTVLDVGCGEGVWLAPLREMRPQIQYLGVDASEYAISRYGRHRNLHRLRFADLAQQRFAGPVDLLVCSDVMHYLSSTELKRGLSGFAELCDGVAFIELYCREDAVDIEGDMDGFYARTAGWYRRTFADAGWRACGSHCYLSPDLQEAAMALEMAPL